MSEVLDSLEKQMWECTDCTLCHDRNELVFGVGNKKPIFMIIGEAPGENEDNGGEPFIGNAGKKLDKILKYVGVTRDEIYITNTVLCRPPNNRNPMMDEMDACRWRLHLQIRELDPDFIVLLGKFATTTYIGHEFKGPLKQFFDQDIPLEIEGKQYKAITTYHPAYLLRTGRRGYKAVLPHWTKVKGWVDEYRSRNVGSGQDSQVCDGQSDGVNSNGDNASGC